MNSDLSSFLMDRLSSPDGVQLGMQDLLAQLCDSDPQMGFIAKYLAQREAAQHQEEESRQEAVEQHATERKAALRRLDHLVRRLYRELEELRQRNDTLAAALGACYLCWGNDPQCDNCGGSGRPGSSLPDEMLFEDLILPAVLAARGARRASGSLGLNGKSQRTTPSAPNPGPIKTETK